MSRDKQKLISYLSHIIEASDRLVMGADVSARTHCIAGLASYTDVGAVIDSVISVL